MRRGITFVLGLAILGTGIWLIVTEHAKNTVCNTGNSQLPGITNSCQSIVWSYYLGFVLIGAGVVLLGFGLLMKAHERRRKPGPIKPPELAAYRAGVHRDSPILWSAPPTPPAPPPAGPLDGEAEGGG